MILRKEIKTPGKKFSTAELQVSDEFDNEDIFDDNTETYGKNKESSKSYPEEVISLQSNTEIAKINTQIENIYQTMQNLESEQNTLSSEKKQVQETFASQLDYNGSKINDLQDKIDTIELNVHSLQE
ncbi:hypothetical protein [Methanohalophilus sp.]